MVIGLDIFRKYFEQYPDNYVIIGGTACDMVIADAGFTPRATKDIDIVLIVEALSREFVEQFWKFIQDGGYERREKSEEERKYYRFMKPANKAFPFQIELFARNPDLLDLEDDSHLTPIPTDDDLSSLSAILLNDDYYRYMVEHGVQKDGLRRVNIEALICLKAKAFLEIKDRLEKGSKEDSRHLKKHKGDIFRLAIMLRENDMFDLPKNIKEHLQAFTNVVANDLPDKAIFKEMGFPGIAPKAVLEQLLRSFQLKST